MYSHNNKIGVMLLTPNWRRVAEDRRDCYWLHVVTDCNTALTLQEPVRDPAKFEWHEVKNVSHYYLSVDSIAQPMRVREKQTTFGEKEP
jgi:hypothetical protein